MVNGDPTSGDSSSRESRQLLFRYRYPWPAAHHPINFYNGGLGNRYHGYNDGSADELLVDSLSSDAVQWMRNLNRDEQESLTAWTLASAAVTSITQGKYAESIPISPNNLLNLYDGSIPHNRYFPNSKSIIFL